MEAYAPLLVLGLLLFLVFAGVEVAVSLGVVSLLAIFISTQDIEISIAFLSTTAYNALRDYVFAVVPLFLLMGEFIARSGIAYDLYWGIDRGLKRLRGRFAYATVMGNVVFAFVSGTSLASATTFTAIAYPQMKRAGYDPHFSLGLISGSACLGMLIPPSILMVVWGILTDLSIGHLFLAGIIPGFILAGLMAAYIFAISVFKPHIVGHGVGDMRESRVETEGPSGRDMAISVVGLVAIVFGALGGIWAGLFTPTEGAGIGALVALGVGLVKGMKLDEIYKAVLAVGRTATPLMIIVFAAQLYSRTLQMSGIGNQLQAMITDSGMSPEGMLIFMVVVWLLLGTIIDSISIMLLTVPIFAPIAMKIGVDPLAFALMGILTIEAGLLTPPFGLVVYAVRAVIPREPVSMSMIFLGAAPFCVMLLTVVAIVYFFPITTRYLIQFFQ
jgi:C4-dicarboxylate transporter DctM subunit